MCRPIARNRLPSGGIGFGRVEGGAGRDQWQFIGVHIHSCGNAPLWELACQRWLFFVYISVPAVTATYGFAFTASPFFKRRNAGPDKSTQKGLPQRPAPSLGSGYLRSGIHPWVIASGWLRWHLLSMTAAAPHRAPRSPRMNTSAQPSEGAGESRSQARSKAAGELTLGLLSGHGERGGLPACLFFCLRGTL